MTSSHSEGHDPAHYKNAHHDARDTLGDAREVDHNAFEALVTEKVDRALAGGKRQDRKQLVIYVVGVVIAAMLMWFIVHYVEDRSRFEAAVNRNCRTTKANTESFDNFVWTIIKTTRSSKVLTKAEIAERVKLYGALYQKVPYCPSLRK